MEDTKVFSSEITRDNKLLKNNLIDLLTVVPAKPLFTENNKIGDSKCSFKPNCEKYYIPKKKSRLKVRTVRNIRHDFEKDVLAYLPGDLEKIQSSLLKKIRNGKLQSENTIKFCQNLLSSDESLSRFVWQMLMNVNPRGYTNPKQYVSWEGKRIQVNGSKGGNKTFIHNFDLSVKKIPIKKKIGMINNKKKKLLTSSLDIKFKPGPLCYKKYLDVSHQKYHVGDTNIITLPKSGLDVYPTYGVVLHPTISRYLNNLRDDNGFISEKWAKLAASAVGSINGTIATQISKESVTFDLSYKDQQSQILMRYDLDFNKHQNLENHLEMECKNEINSKDVMLEIQIIVNDMLDSVEISLLDPATYTKDEENRESLMKETSTPNTNNSSRHRSKKYKELKLLDVTVITLSENSKNEITKKCKMPYCAMGCICSSLEGQYFLKQHCGLIECMFECNCDFSKFKAIDTFEKNCPDYVASLVNIDNQINLRLAKEEQKFHQTVIVTDDKSIVLKSQRRHLKQPKKYADCYTEISKKCNRKIKSILNIPLIKLNCENVEPFCMVHNLYKCFCKGRILNSSYSVENEQHNTADNSVDLTVQDTQIEYNSTGSIKPRALRERLNKFSLSESSVENDINDTNICRRVEPFLKRKYSLKHYKHTHKKIVDFEMNDKTLQNKLRKHIFKARSKTEIDSDISEYVDISNNCESSNTRNVKICSDLLTVNLPLNVSNNITPVVNKTQDTKNYPLLEPQSEINYCNSPSFDLTSDTELNFPNTSITNDSNAVKSTMKRLQCSDKNKLKTWIELNYRKYKEREAQGIQITLEPPKHGKLTLYSGEFILKRYKENKNLVLVSETKPIKIYLAVNNKHPMFKNCININEIRFADLNKYPYTIKSLLTNSSDLKYTFYILYGLGVSWELIGSVKKIDESKTSNIENIETNLELQQIGGNSFTLDSDSSNSSIGNPFPTKRPAEHDYCNLEKYNKKLIKPQRSQFTETITKQGEKNKNNTQNMSKWFAMTIENDFTEIQFYKRGFFVKYESIMKAINVARFSGKTVRLSSQKCVDNSGEQFGVYAIPKQNENCVFVGPYEIYEKLDIETVRTLADVRRQKRTRGLWFMEKKENNSKVIEHPMLFLPPCYLKRKDLLSLENEISDPFNTNVDETIVLNDNFDALQHERKNNDVCSSHSEKQDDELTKMNEPKEFYKCVPGPQIDFQSLLCSRKTLATSSNETEVSHSSILEHIEASSRKPSPDSMVLKSIDTASRNLSEKDVPITFPFSKKTEEYTVHQKPIAEVAPQIKNVFSLCNNVESTNKGNSIKKQNMLILRPEEINKRLEEQTITISLDSDQEEDLIDKTNTNDIDIEMFLASSRVRTAPDVLMISDNEDNVDKEKIVCIQCKNITNIGYIKGKVNLKNHLSFEFPGFKFTDFYSEKEAFAKINQVLARKVYVPKHLNLEWEVIDNFKNLKNKNSLTVETLNKDKIMTKKGLVPMSEFLIDLQRLKNKSGYAGTLNDEVSETLEAEADHLLNQTKNNREDIIKTLSSVLTAELTQQMTDSLKDIMANN